MDLLESAKQELKAQAATIALLQLERAAMEAAYTKLSRASLACVALRDVALRMGTQAVMKRILDELEAAIVDADAIADLILTESSEPVPMYCSRCEQFLTEPDEMQGKCNRCDEQVKNT